MAEALANALSDASFEFHSAGTWPSRTVHPLAVRAMAERGIDISENVPKTFTAVPKPIHWVIAVCGQSAKECPSMSNVTIECWDIDDPVGDGEPFSYPKFVEVREELEIRIRRFLIENKGMLLAQR